MKSSSDSRKLEVTDYCYLIERECDVGIDWVRTRVHQRHATRDANRRTRRNYGVTATSDKFGVWIYFGIYR